MKVIFSVMIDGSEVTFFESETGRPVLRIRTEDMNNPPDFYLTSGQVEALQRAFKALEAMKL